MIATLLNTLQHEVLTWDGITAATHRFGGIEFNLGGIEIGHVHQNGMVDIPLTRKIREALVADSFAEPHHILPETGWISYYIRQERDLAGAVALMRLSYLHKRRRTHPSLAAEIRSLPFSDAVMQAALGQPAAEHDED